MKKIPFWFILLTFNWVSCTDHTHQTATLLCECNGDLVTYNEKMKRLKSENDINSIIELEKTGKEITEKAADCIEKLEDEIGHKRLKDKDFEAKVLSILKEECPKVFEAYKSANNVD